MTVPYANMRFFEGIASTYVTLIVGFTCLILSLICLDYGLSSKYYFHNWIPFYRIYHKFHRVDPVIKRVITFILILLFFFVRSWQAKCIILIAFLIAHYFVLQSWKIKGARSYFFPLRKYIQAFSHTRKTKGGSASSR